MTKIKQTIVISLLLVGCLAAVKPARALTYQELLDYFHQPQVLGASTTGLVGYWNFDEGSGATAADSSGNGNNGTLMNGPTWTVGKVGSGALSFDGVDDYVSISTGLPALTEQTFSVWINPRSAGGSSVGNIINKGPNNAQLRMFFSTGVQFLADCDGTDVSSVKANLLAVNAWNYVAVTWNGQCGTNASVTWFINGNGSSITNLGSGSKVTGGSALAIGSSFDGRIDEARVYNRILSNQEMLDIYNDTSSSSPPSDIQAPTVPTDLTATTISSSQTNLSWTASNDNVGVTGYKIYRNSVQIASTTSNSYSDSGLSASTSYTYTVSAYDLAGNNSSQSSPALTTTHTAITNTYWVSPTGTATWANCKSDAPLSGTAACSLQTANVNAVVGDIVYLRGGSGGSYTTSLGNSAIAPTHSGSCPGTCSGAVGASRIIYSAYNGEVPILQQGDSIGGIGINLNGKNWIKITGITFKNYSGYRAFLHGNASYNEISYCQFTVDPGHEVSGSFLVGDAIGTGDWTSAAVHNWIHHNYFSTIHAADPCAEQSDMLRFGRAQTAPHLPADNNNTAEYNYFEYAGHALFVSNALYNVLANNTFHNEPFIPGCTNWQMATSATSLTIVGSGTIHLVTGTGLTGLTANMPVTTTYALDYARAMEGRVNQAAGGYNSGTGDLYITIDNAAGSGTYANWIIGQGNVPYYANSAYDNLYSHRAIAIGDNHTDATPRRNLVESNRIGFMGVNPGNGGDANMTLAFPYNIARYNYIYGGMDSGIYFKWADGSTGYGGVQNRVYSNTVYQNGTGWARVYGGMNAAYMGQGITQINYSTTVPTNNVVKNNIVYGNGQGDICDIGWENPNCMAASYDTVANNWTTTNGDPKFTNPDLTQPTSQNLFSTAHGYTSTPIPNLSLQSSSPVINQGTYLTTAAGSGTNAMILAVNDASYFQDGSWGSDLARGVDFFPDWIAIGSVNNIVQISSINYNTNTITLASPMTWSNGANIWLYKKSDGAVVLSGSAPDMGAYEYTGGGAPPPSDTTPPSPPTNVQIN
jgi:chitodextrinase